VLASSLASLFATAYMVRRCEHFDCIFDILNLYAFLTLCTDAHSTFIAVHKISNCEE
jgi:uncharacterized membrane protein